MRYVEPYFSVVCVSVPHFMCVISTSLNTIPFLYALLRLVTSFSFVFGHLLLGKLLCRSHSLKKPGARKSLAGTHLIVIDTATNVEGTSSGAGRFYFCNGRMAGKRATRKDYKALSEGRGSIDLSEEETSMSMFF